MHAIRVECSKAMMLHWESVVELIAAGVIAAAVVVVNDQ